MTSLPAYADLFGDSITTPQCSAKHMKSIINAAHGFPEFWKAWPSKSTRKAAKQQCLDKWARFQCATEASLICQHVEWMKTQHDWTKDGGAFIPAPLTYLNQRRWDGWEPPKVKPQDSALEAIKAHRGAAMPADVRAKIASLTRK